MANSLCALPRLGRAIISAFGPPFAGGFFERRVEGDQCRIYYLDCGAGRYENVGVLYSDGLLIVKDEDFMKACW